MVYEWDSYQDLCRRLYVDEGRSVDEVVQYFQEHEFFNPSKRAFQVQFKKWGFSAKRKPASNSDEAIARVRELWEVNKTQTEILRIMNEEGFELSDRELGRLRVKHSMPMRSANGAEPFGGLDSAKDDQLEDVDFANDQDATNESELNTALSNPASPLKSSAAMLQTSIDDDVNRERQERVARVQAESDALYAAKKRRRRTRGWGGLPADPPAPPRFPSETTLDESKAFLHLDNNSYRVMRDQFEHICRDMEIVKKTLAGTERWKAAKDRLVAENAHLNREFFGPLDGVSSDKKSLALDVVCMDVTKRMRTVRHKMTVVEAKNLLGLNPEESRRARNLFFDLLKKENFTSKLEVGLDRWEALKQTWISRSDALQRGLASASDSHDQAEKTKALEVLCRDVHKRLRDHGTKDEPTIDKSNLRPGPGPGPMTPAHKRRKTDQSTAASPPGQAEQQPSPQQQLAPTAQMVQNSYTSAYNPITQSTGDALASQQLTASSRRTAKSRARTNQSASEREERIDPTLLAAATSVDVSANSSWDTASILQQFAQSASSAASSGQLDQAQTQQQHGQHSGFVEPTENEAHASHATPLQPQQFNTQAPRQKLGSSPAAPLVATDFAVPLAPVAICLRLHPACIPGIQKTSNTGQKIWFVMLNTISLSELFEHAIGNHREGTVRVQELEGILPAATATVAAAVSAVSSVNSGEPGRASIAAMAAAAQAATTASGVTVMESNTHNATSPSARAAADADPSAETRVAISSDADLANYLELVRQIAIARGSLRRAKRVFSVLLVPSSSS